MAKSIQFDPSFYAYAQNAQQVAARWNHHYQQYDSPANKPKANPPASQPLWGMRTVYRSEAVSGGQGVSRSVAPVSQGGYLDSTDSKTVFESLPSYSDRIPVSGSGSHYLGVNQSLLDMRMVEDRYHMARLQQSFDLMAGGDVSVVSNALLLASALEAHRNETTEFIIDNMVEDEVVYEPGSDGKSRKKKKTYVCWNMDAFGNWTRHEYRVG